MDNSQTTTDLKRKHDGGSSLRLELNANPVTPQAEKALTRAMTRLRNARAIRNEHRDRCREAKTALAKLYDDLAAQEALVGQFEIKTEDAQETVDTLRDEYAALRDVCCDSPYKRELSGSDRKYIEESRVVRGGDAACKEPEM
ncbi:hypothetical protein BD410DRAFT_845785 [Rickenella mellea]|uniref:Uncharacterized protein n=1 Tax=Rickenella mellea TaxID=50990 RepID=A0A4Y7PJK5_9AGAM|nr:hypothetical protein BD410DRAFT_845785 [Rickenella mellea]